MLSWVTMSVIGGRLLLRFGYRPVTIAGFIVMTTGFTLLAMVQRGMPQFRLYLDLILIGAGLGLTMLTLLIAVQQSVERSQLGVATSLNQFTRAIGGAFGVAIMGAVLTSGLAFQLRLAAQADGSAMTVEQASGFASNPNALIDPAAKSTLSPAVLTELQNAMTSAIHPVFWVGAAVCVLALIAAMFLPKPGKGSSKHDTDDNCGETMLMAEQTTINARNQPRAKHGDFDRDRYLK
jgi:MFS family permease